MLKLVDEDCLSESINCDAQKIAILDVLFLGWTLDLQCILNFPDIKLQQFRSFFFL